MGLPIYVVEVGAQVSPLLQYEERTEVLFFVPIVTSHLKYIADNGLHIASLLHANIKSEFAPHNLVENERTIK